MTDRTDAQAKPLRVLVVEDDPITAEAHAAYVRRCAGFEVAAVAQTGSAAIRALRDAGRNGGIDLVLLDMNLPDMHGLDLCREMRAAGLPTDVIAVTAVREAAVVRSSVHLGIVQYLIKPFTFGTFSAKLEAYREYAAGMARATTSDQHEVDSLFATLRPEATGHTLPKNIVGETRELVRGALEESDGWLSATELGERVSLSRATARRYVEHLVDIGVAERQPRYGAPGRPELEYRARGRA